MKTQIYRWIDDHKDELVETLRKTVSFASVSDKAGGKPGAPFGQADADCLAYVLGKAEELGFAVKNYDGYCGAVDFGEGEEQLGILAHLDVVPAGEDWKYPAYGGEIHGGEIFGRGTLDDKGPAIAALFALAAVKAAKPETRRRVRIILGCDEECGMGCLTHYQTVEKDPDLAFSPDASYPLVNGEKTNFGSSYKKSFASSVRFTAGTVSNAVAGKAELLLPVGRAEVEKAIAACGFDPEFKFDLTEEDGKCRLIVTGVAAHASTPQFGKNAIYAALQLMSRLALPEEDLRTAQQLAAVLGFDEHGERLGIDCSDESGRLTTNVGIMNWDESGIERMTMDIRAPNSADMEEISGKLAEAFAKAGLQEEHHDYSRGYFIPEDSELVSTLMGIYHDHFGPEGKPEVIGGGTYARHLKNAVAFGPERPGEPALIHMANESIKIKHLIDDAKIYADAILALACK